MYDAPPRALAPRAAPASEAGAINAGVGLRLGDTLTGRHLLRPPGEVVVVRVARQPPLGGRPQAFMTLETLAGLIGGGGKLTEIEASLSPGLDPDAFAAGRRPEVPDGFLLETTARVTANVEKNLASSQLGLVLATVLAFLTASFIILTGLTVYAAQQQRELAMLRCFCARLSQLDCSQRLVGALFYGGRTLTTSVEMMKET